MMRQHHSLIKHLFLIFLTFFSFSLQGAEEPQKEEKEIASQYLDDIFIIRRTYITQFYYTFSLILTVIAVFISLIFFFTDPTSEIYQTVSNFFLLLNNQLTSTYHFPPLIFLYIIFNQLSQLFISDNTKRNELLSLKLEEATDELLKDKEVIDELRKDINILLETLKTSKESNSVLANSFLVELEQKHIIDLYSKITKLLSKKAFLEKEIERQIRDQKDQEMNQFEEELESQREVEQTKKINYFINIEEELTRNPILVKLYFKFNQISEQVRKLNIKCNKINREINDELYRIAIEKEKYIQTRQEDLEQEKEEMKKMKERINRIIDEGKKDE
jgi:hypothetical protein